MLALARGGVSDAEEAVTQLLAAVRFAMDHASSPNASSVESAARAKVRALCAHFPIY